MWRPLGFSEADGAVEDAHGQFAHAVARLALPNVQSIQTSWTKMGARGAAMALRCGANDLGGTLMSESISRAAGAAHGQEMTPASMRAIVDGPTTIRK